MLRLKAQRTVYVLTLLAEDRCGHVLALDTHSLRSGRLVALQLNSLYASYFFKRPPTKEII